MLILSWYDGILTSVWSLRKAETQSTCFKWDFQWLRQSFGKISIGLLYCPMSEYFFRYCFLWFMASAPFIFKSSLTAIQIWYCENWIKMTANMVEHPQLGFFYTHVLHNLMCSSNIVRDLIAVTFFLSDVWSLSAWAVLCFPILTSLKFTLVKSLSESNFSLVGLPK